MKQHGASHITSPWTGRPRGWADRSDPLGLTYRTSPRGALAGCGWTRQLDGLHRFGCFSSSSETSGTGKRPSAGHEPRKVRRALSSTETAKHSATKAVLLGTAFTRSSSGCICLVTLIALPNSTNALLHRCHLVNMLSSYPLPWSNRCIGHVWFFGRDESSNSVKRLSSGTYTTLWLAGAPPLAALGSPAHPLRLPSSCLSPDRCPLATTQTSRSSSTSILTNNVAKTYRENSGS